MKFFIPQVPDQAKAEARSHSQCRSDWVLPLMMKVMLECFGRGKTPRAEKR